MNHLTFTPDELWKVFKAGGDDADMRDLVCELQNVLVERLAAQHGWGNFVWPEADVVRETFGLPPVD